MANRIILELILILTADNGHSHYTGWEDLLNAIDALELSRNKPARIELYNLEKDPSEKYNLAKENKEIIDTLSKELQVFIENGTSRDCPRQSNDVVVHFDIIQDKRWGEEIN